MQKSIYPEAAKQATVPLWFITQKAL